MTRVDQAGTRRPRAFEDLLEHRTGLAELDHVAYWGGRAPQIPRCIPSDSQSCA